MKSFLTAGLMFMALALVACAPAGEAVEPEAEIADAEPPTALNPPAAAPRPPSAPPPATLPTAPEPRTLEIPAGTSLTFALIDSLSSDGNMQGDTFQASLAEAVVIDGRTVIPMNAPASGRVLAVDEGGRVSGRARIELLMTSVEAGQQTISLLEGTAPFVAEADPSRGRDAGTIGGAAGVGAAVGGILGGGTGAVIGGAIGGGGGTAVVLATRGNQIELPSETRIIFMVDEPIQIIEGGSR